MKRFLIIGLVLTLSACGARNEGVMQGYGEAEYIYLASQESGVLGELMVREGDAVHAGAPVFSLDPDRLTLNAQSANEQTGAAQQAVRTAQAEATLAETNFRRGAELFQRGFYPRARLDSDRASRDAAIARLAQARREASSMTANTGLARRRVRDLQGLAPTDGTIERIFHRPGEVVAAGEPIARLLPPQNMKVRFFAPEDMLSRLAVGTRVMVSCDGCAAPVEAVVSYVASEPQFTPPIIYSLEQREKLVFLVEARFRGATPVRPGAPVDVRLAE